MNSLQNNLVPFVPLVQGTNSTNSTNEHRYSLEKGSKKHLCPDCNKKTFVRYIDTETGDYLPEQYGRCDRESKCSYHVFPPLETICYFVPTDEIKEISDKAIVIKQGKNEQIVPKKAVFEQTSDGLYLAEYFLKDTTGKRNLPLTIKYNESDCKVFNSEGEAVLLNKTKAVKRPKPQTEPVFFDFETFKQTLQLERYEKNTFIQNLFYRVQFPFEVDEVTKVIQLYRLGTVIKGSWTGAVTLPYIDKKGFVRTVQVKKFDEQNHTTAQNKLDKVILSGLKKENRAVPEWLTKYIEYGDEYGYFTCLFGEHLLSKYHSNPVVLVEAPKTAVYGTLYFGLPETPESLIWLAVYNKSSFSFDKLKVLKGRFVYVFPDLSKDGNTFKEWETKAKDYESRLPGTRFIFSDILEQKATPEQREQGADIADVLITKGWRDFRKQKIQDPPPKPEPPRHNPQQVVETNNYIKVPNTYNKNGKEFSKLTIQIEELESKIRGQQREIEGLESQCKTLESTFIQASQGCELKWYRPSFITGFPGEDKLSELKYWCS